MCGHHAPGTAPAGHVWYGFGTFVLFRFFYTDAGHPADGNCRERERTDDVAVALTNACYKALQSSNLYNQRMWSLDIVAGNSLVGAGGGTDGLETIQASKFITESDTVLALDMWRFPWVGYRAV